jgi:hypothetical protein
MVCVKRFRIVCSHHFTATVAVTGASRVNWDSIFNMLFLVTSDFCATVYNEWYPKTCHIHFLLYPYLLILTSVDDVTFWVKEYRYVIYISNLSGVQCASYVHCPLWYTSSSPLCGKGRTVAAVSCATHRWYQFKFHKPFLHSSRLPKYDVKFRPVALIVKKVFI